MSGWWVPRDQDRNHQFAINLNKPGLIYKAGPVSEQPNAREQVTITKMQNAQDILETVRKYSLLKIERRRLTAQEVETSMLPMESLLSDVGSIILWGYWSEAWKEASCGRTHLDFLKVPAEEKYRRLALAKAKSGSAHGACMLRNYPGQETVKVLKSLLDDPTEDMTSHYDSGSRERQSEICFPVRAAAYYSLLTLGVKVQKPMLRRLPTFREMKTFR